LFLTTGKNVFPFFPSIPTAFAIGKIAETSFFKHALEFDISTTTITHLNFSVGVKDLIAERADGEIGSLREEHDAVCSDAAGAGDETTVDGPETCYYAGDG
jgi:hypothetical protein